MFSFVRKRNPSIVEPTASRNAQTSHLFESIRLFKLSNCFNLLNLPNQCATKWLKITTKYHNLCVKKAFRQHLWSIQR